MVCKVTDIRSYRHAEAHLDTWDGTDVHMRVDEARTDVFALDIDLLYAVVEAGAGLRLYADDFAPFHLNRVLAAKQLAFSRIDHCSIHEVEALVRLADPRLHLEIREPGKCQGIATRSGIFGLTMHLGRPVGWETLWRSRTCRTSCECMLL